VADFKAAADLDPQPAYQVRLASALQATGKNDEAIALCDKLLADPQLHPQIKTVATQVKNAATAAKGGK
jgi:predicted Zn-dependent protease